MTQFNAYLTSEVVEDYSDGIIGRREALRRLGMLGVAVTAATPMLAACETDGSDGTAGPTTAGPARSGPAGPSPLPTGSITFDGPEGRELQGAWAAADQPRGAVLVIHENRGLTDHIRSVAGRLAASGYSALAVDCSPKKGARHPSPTRRRSPLPSIRCRTAGSSPT